MKAVKIATVVGVGIGLMLICLRPPSVEALPVMRGASTHTVTNTDASGPGSLRQAILDANASGGHDTVTFAPGVSGIIVLTSTLPEIDDHLTIVGPGADTLAISGDNSYRVLRVASGVTVTISGVTIRDGNAYGSPGGGIRSAGALILTATHVVSNNAVHGGGVYVGYGSATLSGGQIVSNTAEEGAGLYVSSGSVVLNGVQVLGNSAEYGSGVFISDGSLMLKSTQVISNSASFSGAGIFVFSGTLNMLNTTVSGNRATGGGGGGLLNSGGRVSITFSTIASNTATIDGYGLRLESGTMLLQDTIVAHNGTEETNCTGLLVSNGHNLEYGYSCNLTASSDITNTDPLLGPLTHEGGMWIHPLLEDSPAINAGLCLVGVPTDQRGWTRIPPCDIGAYEYVFRAYLPLVLRS